MARVKNIDRANELPVNPELPGHQLLLPLAGHVKAEASQLVTALPSCTVVASSLGPTLQEGVDSSYAVN